VSTGYFRPAFLAVLWFPFSCLAQTAANPLSILPSDRITARIDNQVTVTLPGNVHPLARPEDDAGPVPPSYPMPHLFLVLKRSAAQQAALDALANAQQDRQSPLYHHWLSPAEFGAHFGVSRNDVDRIAAWLTSQGFTIDDTPVEHTTIKFSGTASQVEAAFHTPIHFYNTARGLHFANARDQQIPQALSGVVAGVAALHNLRPRPMVTAKPQFLTGSGYALLPSDFQTIYNLNPLLAAGIDGTGVSIAVTAECSIDESVVTKFWNAYAKTGKTLTDNFSGGVTACDTELAGEVFLDLEWSGAVAKGASLILVASDNIVDAAYQVIHNRLAPIVTTSYGTCETGAGNSGNSFLNEMWQQAAAAGITAFVSSGDSGAAGCDDQNSVSIASQGPSVNALCSPQFVTCVGGTQFNEGSNSTQYWSRVGVAQGYIPELAWNESGLATGGQGIWASGGGYSTIWPKPSWQTGNSNSNRGVPDVALTAAAHDSYITCLDTGCGPSDLWLSSGTSAASPSFAGIMALVVQKTGQWQGNVNPVLYGLAANTSLAVFHDVTSGNNNVPGQQGYSAGPGWDPVTGLGSVDANALVNNWPGSTQSGPAVSLSAFQLAFGNQAPGTSSAAQTVTLTSSGSSALSIGTVTLSGSNPGDFAMTTTCPNVVLNAGKSCNIAIVFTPAAAGSRTASISIADSATNSPQTIQLTGTGVAPAVSVTNVQVSKIPPPSCTPPPSATSFLTTDASVYLFFDAVTSSSDNLSSDWLAPNGTVLAGTSWQSSTGTHCFVGTPLNIANLTTAQLGTWTAQISDNGRLLTGLAFKVSAPAGPAPSISSGGIVNNAGYKSPVSPGSIAALFGSNLATATSLSFPFPLPLAWSGTSVTVAGISAPLLYVSPGQIGIQVPPNTPLGTATVVVTVKWSSSERHGNRRVRRARALCGFEWPCRCPARRRQRGYTGQPSQQRRRDRALRQRAGAADPDARYRIGRRRRLLVCRSGDRHHQWHELARRLLRSGCGIRGAHANQRHHTRRNCSR
jgi:hypothetical protein